MKKNDQINQRILEKINSFQDPSLRALMGKTLELAVKSFSDSAIQEQIEAHVLKLVKEEKAL